MGTGREQEPLLHSHFAEASRASKEKSLAGCRNLGGGGKKQANKKTHKLCRAGKCSIKDWGLQKAVAQYSRHSVWMRWQQELMLAIPGDSKA